MTFRDLDVFDFTPRFDSPQAGSLDDFTFESRGYGVATPWKPTGAERRTLKLPFLLSGVDVIGALRTFFETHRMRLKPFWMPTYTGDFPLLADAAVGATQITVAGHEFSTRYQIGAPHKFIALAAPDKLECYGVSAVDATGSDDVLTLSRGLDTDLVAEETISCPLLLVRAAEDELAYEYRAGDVIAAELEFVECATEYPAPDATASALDTAHWGTRPVFLYRLSDGSTTLYLADYGADLAAAGQTWKGADISHDSLQAASDMLGDAVNVTLRTRDGSHPLLAYLNEFALSVFTLDIFEADMEHLDLVNLTTPVHTGRIESAEFDKEGAISLQVSSMFRVGEREIPTLRVQRTCNWRTYDGIGCKALAADFTTTGTITGLSAVSPVYIEAAEFGAKAAATGDPNWFALGKVTVGKEVRICTGQEGNRLYLNFPFTQATVGGVVSALAGDDKRISTCHAKFNQLINHSGMPYLPNNSPQLDPLEQPAATGGKKG